MPTRTAPAWFRRRLAAHCGDLRVVWSDKTNRWVIQERVPRATFVGHLGEDRIINTYTRYERVIYAKELGSHVIDWVKRVDMRRFDSAEEMIEKLDIDKDENGRSAKGFASRLGRT